MEKSRKKKSNRLIERTVRNDDIFCSILFDQTNRTLRVVDFRGGNFQNKHNYLEKVLVTEGMRKIFTLIERDDISGWQRVGYQREGAIPGYYKRSDAYIMSRIYDEDFDVSVEHGEDTSESKKFLGDAKVIGKEYSETKAPGIKLQQVSEEEAMETIRAEVQRLNAKATKGSKKKGSSKKPTAPVMASDLDSVPPVFPQFSREVEFHYFVAQNRRTKQVNIIGAEYQDCFGNCKVQVFFRPETKTDQNLARAGLNASIDALAEIGAVSIFATAGRNDANMNALYVSAGFRNTGWLNRHTISPGGPVDQILWTRKLI